MPGAGGAQRGPHPRRVRGHHLLPAGPGHGERPHERHRPGLRGRPGHRRARRGEARGQGRPGERVVSIGGPRDRGGVVVRYRKLHLFAEEKHCFEPGDLGLPVFETRWGIAGICVSYDMRFVGVVRILALRGADLVCVPTVWGDRLRPQAPNPDGLCPPKPRGPYCWPKPPKNFFSR